MSFCQFFCLILLTQRFGHFFYKMVSCDYEERQQVPLLLWVLLFEV